MPIYEYACTECDHHLEKFQKISAPDPTECPHCKHHTLKRQVSAAAFALKGSGWYVTDFKNTNKKPAKETKETKETTKETTPDKKNKAETKTETKSDSKKKPPSPDTSSDKK